MPPLVDAGAAADAPLPAVFRKSKAPAELVLVAAAPKPPKPENILGPSYTRKKENLIDYDKS